MDAKNEDFMNGPSLDKIAVLLTKILELAQGGDMSKEQSEQFYNTYMKFAVNLHSEAHDILVDEINQWVKKVDNSLSGGNS